MEPEEPPVSAAGRRWLRGLLAAAVILRVLLCWANPPENAFDDHFEPILKIMATGRIPAKDACFECYHPPVFYAVSAMLGKAGLAAGLPEEHLLKLLQLVSGAAGVLLLVVCLRIVLALPISEIGKILAFGTVCVLPRHVYMSAMHSNDTASYLLAALAVERAIVMLRNPDSWPNALATGLAATAAVFTKYTALALIPALAAAVVVAWRRRLFGSRRSAAAAAIAAVGLPSVVLGLVMVHDARRYGSPLPQNFAIYDPSVDRPRDPGGVDFLSFEPWVKVSEPILVPGQLHSFWTLIYSGMWFDTEPYFVDALDANEGWWDRYYAWYRGEGPYPGSSPSMTRTTRLTADGLFLLGLVPLALAAIGVVSGARRLVDPRAAPWVPPALALLGVLLACNVAGAVAYAVRLPVYNAMKPSYLLASTPALMALVGLGVDATRRFPRAMRPIAILMAALFALSSAHLVEVAVAMFRRG